MLKQVNDTGIVQTETMIPETLEEHLELLENHPDVRDKESPMEVLVEILKDLQELFPADQIFCGSVWDSAQRLRSAS